MIHKSVYRAITMIALSAMTLNVQAQVVSQDLKEEYTPLVSFGDAEASLGNLISWIEARTHQHTSSKILVVFQDCFKCPVYTAVILVSGVYTELDAVRTASNDDIAPLFY